jgi:transcriptional regulator GlxA family with amidase domain
LLEQGQLPVERIAQAQEIGFGDRERMRRSFVRSFGQNQTPQAVHNASHSLATIWV